MLVKKLFEEPEVKTTCLLDFFFGIVLHGENLREVASCNKYTVHKQKDEETRTYFLVHQRNQGIDCI